MPYIAQKDRDKLDPLIDELSRKIVEQSGEYDGAFAGLLNYTCTRLALKIIRLRFGRMRYWLLAEITGIFKNIADEFYRRLGIPYEDKQIAKNGDVDLYEEFFREIEGI
ncbi:MAG: hypothetical protein WAP23_03640 [Candidatus Spechtbacterales bacterium]